MRKLGIIGLGNVGALLANLLVARQIVDELVLIDTNSDLAVGLQNDLLDGMSALAVQPTIKVQDYAALKDADAVVLAAVVLRLISAISFLFTVSSPFSAFVYC